MFHANEAESGENHRNGSSSKTVLTPGGAIQSDVPRDRLASFEPKLVARHQRRWKALTTTSSACTPRGMSVREIQGQLLELFCKRPTLPPVI